MQRLLKIGILAATAAFTLVGQDYRGAYGGVYGGVYGGNQGGGYRGSACPLCDRVQSDLSRSASASYYSGSLRHKIDDAQRALGKFQGQLDGGRFDRHQLDRAIGELNEAAHNRDLRPRERDRLLDDLVALRNFRAGQEGYYEDRYRR